MASGKQDVRAACPKDKVEFKFFQALQQNSDVRNTGERDSFCERVSNQGSVPVAICTYNHRV